MPDIDSLSRHDPLVVSDLPGQLVFANIVGKNLGSPMLEDAIGEPAGRCPRVQNHHAIRIDTKLVECFFDLQASAAHILGPALDEDLSVIAHLGAGLQQTIHTLDSHFTGEDESFRHLARVTHPATMQGLIEAFLSHPNCERRNHQLERATC